MTTKTKQILIAIGLVTLVVISVIIYISSNNKVAAPALNTTNTNPIIESYKNDLPALEQKAQTSDSKSIRNYAVALYATGDLEGAKEQYLRELEVNPSDAVLYNNLGNIYRDNGEYQKAVDSYQKSIDLDKSQLNVYVNLANLYIYVLQQPEMGYGVYLKGIENSPNNKESLLLTLANAYRDAGLKEKAKDTYNEILKINPDNDTVKNLLASL